MHVDRVNEPQPRPWQITNLRVLSGKIVANVIGDQLLRLEGIVRDIHVLETASLESVTTARRHPRGEEMDQGVMLDIDLGQEAEVGIVNESLIKRNAALGHAQAQMIVKEGGRRNVRNKRKRKR